MQEACARTLPPTYLGVDLVCIGSGEMMNEAAAGGDTRGEMVTHRLDDGTEHGHAARVGLALVDEEDGEVELLRHARLCVG